MEKFWHNVKEELPERCINVLCSVEATKEISALCFGYLTSKNEWVFFGNHCGGAVTHWAYIPKV